MLLMNFVITKKWQLGPVAEKALRTILEYKRKSKGVKKK